MRGWAKGRFLTGNTQNDYVYVKEPEKYFYHDLPEEDQKKWISKLKHHPMGCV